MTHLKMHTNRAAALLTSVTLISFVAVSAGFFASLL